MRDGVHDGVAALAAAQDAQEVCRALSSRWVQALVVLVMVLQGLGLYGLVRWVGPRPSAVWMGASMLVLALPPLWAMSVVAVRDRLLWVWMLVAAALVWVPSVSFWRTLQPPAGAVHAGHWAVWAWLALPVVLFMFMAWMQAVLVHRRVARVPYGDLFTLAWNNAVIMVLVALFAGLCWMVLALWAGLFAMVGVRWFAQAFASPLFVCVASGAMLGVGVVLVRGQPRPIGVLLQLKLALFRLLLPLLALVVVLFVGFLPVSGVQPLWDTGHATALLAAVQLCLLLFVNAVFQDGRHARAPYSAPVRWLVDVALLLMPVLAVLAVWAVWLRVDQYGWTVQRVAGMAVAGVLLLYALGYAAAVLRGVWALARQPAVSAQAAGGDTGHKLTWDCGLAAAPVAPSAAWHWLGGTGAGDGGSDGNAEAGCTASAIQHSARGWRDVLCLRWWCWLDRASRVACLNQGMSLVVMGLVVAMFTPVLDPYRISAHSQRERLLLGQEPVSMQALLDLRFQHGAHGEPALVSLWDTPPFATPDARTLLERALRADAEDDGLDVVLADKSAPDMIQDLRTAVHPAPGHAMPPPEWWTAVGGNPALRLPLDCPAPTSEHPGGAPQPQCVVMQLALDRQASTPQQVVCELYELVPECEVFVAGEDGVWSHAGSMRWPALDAGASARLQQAIRAGNLAPRPPRWMLLGAPGAADLPAASLAH